MTLPTIIILLVAALLFLAAVLILRTIGFPTRFAPVENISLPDIDPDTAAEHLGSAIRLETVSHSEREKINYEKFAELHRLLKKSYPLVHKHLNRQTINEHSLLFTWEGKDPSLKSVLLMAHQDVVPADPSTLDKWEHAPFSGEVVDGFVWGRGAMDMKSQVIAVLEAVEYLLGQGFQPERRIYLAFGHDEEIGGLNGAKQIARHLQEQGVQVEAVLDEGGMILSDVIASIAEPVALVGIAEKGFLTLKLRVDAEGGHSAAPPNQTAIGIMARGLARLEAYQLKSHPELVAPMMRGFGYALPFGLRLVFANLWLFGVIVRRKLLADSKIASVIRTTTAPTIINGGIKDNILPQWVEATVNFRLSPRDTIANVCEHVRKVMDDDRIRFEPAEGYAWEASPVSSTNSTAYNILVESIRQVFGEIPVSPYHVIGGTDSRYFSPLSESVFRFSPVHGTKDDMERVHGVNERLSVGNLECMIKFFIQIIQRWSAQY